MAFWVVYTAVLVFVALCFAGAAFACFRPRRRRARPRLHHRGAEFDGRCSALVAQRLVAPRIALAEARRLKPFYLNTKGLNESAEFEAILDAIADDEALTEVPSPRRPA